VSRTLIIFFAKSQLHSVSENNPSQYFQFII
jgi:hypothetical protein